MNEGEYYAAVILLNELKRFPDTNESHIRYLESQLQTININNLRGDSIG